jgi:hypothetical protein
MTAATVPETPAGARASTINEGLDAVLGGGIARDRLYLLTIRKLISSQSSLCEDERYTTRASSRR